MGRQMDRLRLIGLIAAGVATLVAAEPAAHAQYRLAFSYCDRLQAQYLGVLKQAGNTGMTLVIALNYGSQSEIVEAAKSIARDAVAPGRIVALCDGRRIAMVAIRRRETRPRQGKALRTGLRLVGKRILDA